MFNKGDKVSVLDEAIDGVVLSMNGDEVTIETADGFMMTFFVNELLKVPYTSNLMNSIRRVNVSEISKEKEIPKARSFVKEKKSKHEIPAPEFDL
ncbi:MAG: DNA mismatch repair protein MutS, partial [Methylotenera sp.]|nr:DNA mismatch repair protein MutS [Flavobacterium sp.]